MIRNQLFIAAALFVGVAIGYLMKPDAKPVEAAEDKGPVAASAVDDRGAAASLQALRTRIAELEKLLAEKAAEAAPVQVAEAKPVEAAQQGERRGPPSMKEMRERMEQMAKDDPERFAQMTNRMARWRQRRIDRANAKLDFLESVDTSKMTAEQKKVHDAFQNLLVRREELVEKMHNPEMTDEDREDIFRDMRETDHAMRQAARAEREALISQAAQALGFTGEDAATVSATFGDIISSTETSHGFGPPHGGPGGPGALP